VLGYYAVGQTNVDPLGWAGSALAFQQRDPGSIPSVAHVRRSCPHKVMEGFLVKKVGLY